jgi:beta-1,4-N-acetylglucosaminyltransferase
MEKSDLIISHGGAGCIFESLNLNKKLVAVINEKLMDNHQQELVNELQKENFLISANCKSIFSLFEKEKEFLKRLE